MISCGEDGVVQGRDFQGWDWWGFKSNTGIGEISSSGTDGFWYIFIPGNDLTPLILQVSFIQPNIFTCPVK